eukprot:Skav234841  [mRNA]  locus=scaffold1428:275955:276593:- [translate_table: standard]
MQNWKAKYARRVVAGGALKGAHFEDLTYDQLVKASKRYPADSRLQKYAKTVVTSMELDGAEGEPEPCLPLAVRQTAVEAVDKEAWKNWLWRILRRLTLHRAVVFCLVFMAVILIVKPSLATACTRVLVKFFRLALRRLTGFLLLILEGLLDELVYQIEFSLRQALPQDFDWDQLQQNPLNLFSHLLSALSGAAISMLSSYMVRRHRPIPAVD